jgi:hypothetical protein
MLCYGHMYVYIKYIHIYIVYMQIQYTLKKCILKHHIISTVKSANSNSFSKSSLLKDKNYRFKKKKEKSVHLYKVCIFIILIVWRLSLIMEWTNLAEFTLLIQNATQYRLKHGRSYLN